MQSTGWKRLGKEGSFLKGVVDECRTDGQSVGCLYPWLSWEKGSAPDTYKAAVSKGEESSGEGTRRLQSRHGHTEKCVT